MRRNNLLVDVRTNDWVSRFEEIAELRGRVSCEKPLDRDKADEPRTVADCDFGCTFERARYERGAGVSRLSLEGSARYFPDEKIGRPATASGLGCLDDRSFVREKESMPSRRDGEQGKPRRPLPYLLLNHGLAERGRSWCVVIRSETRLRPDAAVEG